MARLSDIKITVDPFITRPRLRVCLNQKCRFLGLPEELTCRFREVEIDADGKCKQFEEEPERS